jgi:hypothetical protein
MDLRYDIFVLSGVSTTLLLAGYWMNLAVTIVD